jgi:YYY domain-containing protein
MNINTKSDLNRWLTAFLLILILAAGAYLRFVGLDWDIEQHLHPDERFLTMVEASLIPVDSVSGYFDTSTSTLNPNNQGHGFFVYGTLPIFMVRYMAELVGSTGYGNVYLVGRAMSAVMDILSVVLVFFIGTRLYDRRVGLLGAAFSAFAVLQIQQSHFFTVDTFATFFTVLAVYFAVEVGTAKKERIDLISYLFFGVALGMAVASKINSVPVAITLPVAALVYWLRLDEEKKDQQIPRIFLFLVLAALTSLVTFRICQPYAFNGPGFFNVGLNENWISSMRSIRAQASGDVDYPPALQWARRPLWFSLQNMVVWGLGIPFGLLAWSGFAWTGWKIFSKRDWKPDLVLWVWTGIYFAWQSLQWNSTMRYQLPIYPLLAVFAAWALIEAWKVVKDGKLKIGGWSPSVNFLRPVVILIGTFSLLFTAGWAFAFSRIYTDPQPRVAATRWIFENIPGAATLSVEADGESHQQLLSYPQGAVIQGSSNWLTSFDSKFNGLITSLYFPDVVNHNPSVTPVTINVMLNDASGTNLAEETGELTFQEGSSSGSITFSDPVPVTAGEVYQLSVAVLEPAGAIALQGTGIANESSWDDGIPLRMDGYDPFGGIYRGGLNFELYWDDNLEKLDRFISTLNQSDYIMITSSRQWATTTRVPERYPLTSEYYRQLMGCPVDLSIEDCYNQARPGDYQGSLGFELIQTFQNDPTIGPIVINDQPAEEAFTVYDHPKVFIFQKADDFSLSRAANILSAVDLSKVIHITPKQADSHPGNLLLPLDRLADQREGGTWSEIFDYDSFQNKYQFVGMVYWYAAVFLLGLLVYPLLRLVLPGLTDKGYPLARTFGLLLLSYLVWLAGSAGVPFLRSTIFAVLFLIACAGLYAGYRQRGELLEEWKGAKRYYLTVEIIALALFVVAILIRYGNPDLWHPWKGGERPMDFSYFNAVLKSTTFPPYDPWFAGGYINYYYYGFVFVGVLTKLLGIVPAFAYNLILPTLFMALGLGAFSIAWNLLDGNPSENNLRDKPYLAGGSGVLGLAIFGNLGVIQMVLRGLQRLASAGVNVTDGNFFQRFKWTLLGIVQLVNSPSLHYRLDEWYWNPSRVISAEHGGPITEFPFFTFLYGDPHAHFISLPLTVLALAWILSIVKSARQKGLNKYNFGNLIGVTLVGGLAVGVLRPTNTWDFYPYLALGAAALIYAWWQESKQEGYNWFQPALRLLLFLGFAFITFQPYANWYGEGYTSIKPWFGSHTPLREYFTHWGFFLLILVSWMFAETVDWMAKTPVSALNELKKYRELIIAGLLIMAVIMVSFGVTLENDISVGGFTLVGGGVHIIWFVLPSMVWALILLFRPGQSLMKGVVLFLIGTSLAITLMVEVVYVEGDIGRMNTVFKFYLQAWTLMTVSAAAALYWLIPLAKHWTAPIRITWRVVFLILLSGAALYPILGGVAKVKDRMVVDAPHTLDGMDFMKYAIYHDLDTAMDLSQDYEAIRWIQDNVQGSPVIVEANQVEYHWATRYTVYTGLPGVVGWNWHQRQQRTITPHDWIFSRVEDVNVFYDTADLDAAKDFLEEYQVRYIIVGQLERAKYLPEGIEKFDQGLGDLWRVVYQSQDTTIYQTISEAD